jgi:hypothetical protein
LLPPGTINDNRCRLELAELTKFAEEADAGRFYRGLRPRCARCGWRETANTSRLAIKWSSCSGFLTSHHAGEAGAADLDGTIRRVLRALRALREIQMTVAVARPDDSGCRPTSVLWLSLRTTIVACVRM